MQATIWYLRLQPVICNKLYSKGKIPRKQRETQGKKLKTQEKTQNSRKKLKTQEKNSIFRHFQDLYKSETCPKNKPGLLVPPE